MADATKSTDPSALIIPFGKHKGATVAELLARDPAYADWVAAQAWVADRFAELHAAILSRGAGLDDSPEHNALQARFLEPAFRLAVVRLVVPAEQLIKDQKEAKEQAIRWRESEIAVAERRIADYQSWNRNAVGADERKAELRSGIIKLAGEIDGARRVEPPLVTEARFEENGIDVILPWGFVAPTYLLKIELKPSMGDDYPTVMRQMKRLGAWLLVVEQYTGRGVSETQMRGIFTASRLTVLFTQEIEEAMQR